MGPAATIDFYSRIVARTPSLRDQDHIPTIIWADPRIPDRSDALLGLGLDPSPRLAEGARGLEAAGCTVIAVPCNTAHAFLESVSEATTLPIIDMVDVASRTALSRGNSGVSVGILATTGTLLSGLYQQRIAAGGGDALIPSAADQERLVMTAIRSAKAGRPSPIEQRLLTEAVERLTSDGADVVLLACSELSVVFGLGGDSARVIDAIDCLADEVIAHFSTSVR